ncbi:signal transduction histidine kinase [Actinoplanes octamycinicus]|uniref:histidine kinase n=1 Tax=Actinoplanes octamycinicus TaxID=135948 RepID=A0A7W7M978_9ACTN|nr:ATP-binding protein [Actinoplanes octamycinicus]MBB4741709.1 signal transduction histidine kinase [Actinoplanes octamycinicus]GIE57262.1 hypothetical protein Aoc01nite_26640 [Actinoplanes octamycinicus]
MRLSLRRRPIEPGLVLTRSLCHELRPPMATLRGLLRALESTPPGPRREQLLSLATEHVVYAEAVLGDAAEAALGLTDGQAAPVPLHDILPAVWVTAPPGALAVTASRAALRWPVHPHHTKQILINLVGNAVRHAPGPIRLRAVVRARQLRLAVTDQGRMTTGLRTALRRRTAPADEHGLGLWVVRQRLADLGGTVRARQLAPTGLRVEASLPRHG